ncbi:hypothetical protein ALC60_08197, partial [Trachymyrmex zeteki]
KCTRLSTGNRQSVIACIAWLESLKDSVRGRFVHVGVGYGLRWHEIEMAFESRILTDAVNSNYIEPRRFLEDVSEIVLDRELCIMQRYGCHIKLPQEIMLKRAVINVRSTDNACFAWSVVAALHPVQKHVDRESSYSHYSSVLNLQDIQFPMTNLIIGQFTTHMNQHHNVFSIGYYVHCSYDRSLSGYRFRDNCSVARGRIEKSSAQCTVDNVPRTDFTRNDWEKFNSASHCHVCEKPFTPDDTRVRDHCHLIGRYRGSAHSNCNLSYKDSRCISVVFHNSLDKLSSFFNNDKLRILRREFSDLSEENFNLLIRKDVFLYECIDCSEKLNELCLPPRESFYSSLMNNTVSESDYGHIELNTKFRILAKDNFEKNLSKLMNNAIFDKTMENVRDSVDVKLLTIKWEGRYGAQAMIAKSNFRSRSVFSENLVATELRKFEVKFDKPIYVGMCILDISKTCLYEFHHEYMAPLFRDKCKIMYTDSLIYHVECDDVYDIVKRDINRFDTNDYSIDNAYGIPLANKKVPGLMKENNGAIMIDFVGLRAKMYALRVQGKKDTKKAKSDKSSVMTKSITFEDYTRCLNDEMTRRQSCIRSKLHKEYTISETKIAPSPHDDKRCIVSGSTDTLPWGHYRCK